MHCIWIDTFHCNTLFNIYICFIVIHCLYIYLIVIDCIWIYTFHCKILFIYICLIVKHCIWIERLFHCNTLFNIYICFIVIHCIWIKRLFHSNTFALIAYTTFTGFNVKDASSFPSSTPTEGYVAWNALLTRTRSNSLEELLWRRSAFGELLRRPDEEGMMLYCMWIILCFIVIHCIWMKGFHRIRRHHSPEELLGKHSFEEFVCFNMYVLGRKGFFMCSKHFWRCNVL